MDQVGRGRSLWYSREGNGVESNRPGGVEEGYSECYFGSRGAVLWEDCSMPSGHEFKAGERSVTRRIVKVVEVVS